MNDEVLHQTRQLRSRINSLRSSLCQPGFWVLTMSWIVHLLIGVIHKACSQISASFQPSPFLSIPVRFCLTTHFPLSVLALSWKTVEELHEIWEIITFNRKQVYCIYFSLASFFTLKRRKMMIQSHLYAFSSLKETELKNDVHFQLIPLPLSTFFRIFTSHLPPRCGHSVWCKTYF